MTERSRGRKDIKRERTSLPGCYTKMRINFTVIFTF